MTADGSIANKLGPVAGSGSGLVDQEVPRVRLNDPSTGGAVATSELAKRAPLCPGSAATLTVLRTLRSLGLICTFVPTAAGSLIDDTGGGIRSRGAPAVRKRAAENWLKRCCGWAASIRPMACAPGETRTCPSAEVARISIAQAVDRRRPNSATVPSSTVDASGRLPVPYSGPPDCQAIDRFSVAVVESNARRRRQVTRRVTGRSVVQPALAEADPGEPCPGSSRPSTGWSQHGRSRSRNR